MKKIVLIGSGNVATAFARNIKERNEASSQYTILQVYSPNKTHAEELARQVDCEAISDCKLIRQDADLYLFAVKDAALEEVVAQIPTNEGMWVHTSGSMSMDVFASRTNRYGVLYPLQTFSKGRYIPLCDVPLFLECHAEEDLPTLEALAMSLSHQVHRLDSTQRRTLHLAAVLACNFTNHLYALSANLLEAKGLSFEYLLPLIQETTAKLSHLSPREAQTGPAIRFDTNIIYKHLQMLEGNPSLQTLYKQMSESIYNMYKG